MRTPHPPLPTPLTDRDIRWAHRCHSSRPVQASSVEASWGDDTPPAIPDPRGHRQSQKTYRPRWIGQRRNPCLAAAGDSIICRRGTAPSSRGDVEHGVGGARGVGHEDNVSSFGFPAQQPPLGTRKEAPAVVHHPPNVAKYRAILGIQPVEYIHAPAMANARSRWQAALTPRVATAWLRQHSREGRLWPSA